MDRRFRAPLVLAVLLAFVAGMMLTQFTERHFSYGAAASSGNVDDAGFDKLGQIYFSMLNDYYLELDGDELIEGAIEGMLAVAGDPYTFYYTAEEWAAAMSDSEGVYAGIGIQVLDSEDASSMLITRCFKDSPAQRAGLTAGDLIVAVDGYPLAAALGGSTNYLPAQAEPTAAGEGEGRAMPSNRTELLGYMRGEEGSQITLKILRGGELIDFTLTREVIHMNRVEYCMLNGGEAGPAVGYMAIYEFQGDAAEGVKQAVSYFNEQGAQALVVDLRNNPGGNLDVVTSIVETLLPEGLYAYIEDRHGNRQEFHSSGECWGRPMAVLVNGYSASASELFTGAAKDMGAAVIVGQTTFGKGIVQSVVGMMDGSGYQLTTARYFTPSGHVIQGNGIAPDVEVELTEGSDSAALSSMIVAGGVDWQECDAQLLAAWQELKDMVAAGWTLPAQADGAAAGAEDAPAATDAAATGERLPGQISDCV